ncbi:MAG: terminase small subunit [Halioglobus sp.]|nr:terminase small subunit [Halioglobus sp.]
MREYDYPSWEDCSKRKLTAKQVRFVQEYLIDLNATQAAIRAGYSSKTAAAIGSENLRKPDIAACISGKIAARSERLRIDADYVLNRLVAEVEADMVDLYDDNNRLRPVHQWPPVWRQGLVSSLDVQEIFAGRGDERQHVGCTTKIRFSERAQRLISIGKHVNVQAFKENIGLDGALSLEAFVLAKAKDREEREERNDGTS